MKIKISPFKICVFVILMIFSMQASAEYYIVTEPCGFCKKVVVHRHYHYYKIKKIKKPRHYYPRTIHHYYKKPRIKVIHPPVYRSWGCCGFEGYCERPYQVHYVRPSDRLNVYDGEYIDDRATADDWCPDMQIN